MNLPSFSFLIQQEVKAYGESERQKKSHQKRPSGYGSVLGG